MNKKFSEAIEALKQGKRATRLSWSEPGFSIFMQVPSEIKKDIVPKMQSLPQAVKDEFVKRFIDDRYQLDAIYYNDQIAMVNQSNLIVGYTPSTSDVLSEDWIILD